jgi:uracil-DNA glycosylase
LDLKTGYAVQNMDLKLPPRWQKELISETSKPYFIKLKEQVVESYSKGQIYPASQNIFKAFTLTDFDSVRVVILGQDPYHGDGQAEGLSFSVPEGTKLPPSLRNIYKELKDDLGVDRGQNGNLEVWAKQGVLLLNATLTVEAGNPGSHQGIGWEEFTDNVIKIISDKKSNMIFVLWGKYAEAKASLIDSTKHLIITSPHPSPFSAHRGFFGSKPFSQTNEYLKKTGQQTINW